MVMMDASHKLWSLSAGDIMKKRSFIVAVILSHN